MASVMRGIKLNRRGESIAARRGRGGAVATRGGSSTKKKRAPAKTVVGMDTLKHLLEGAHANIEEFESLKPKVKEPEQTKEKKTRRNDSTIQKKNVNREGDGRNKTKGEKPSREIRSSEDAAHDDDNAEEPCELPVDSKENDTEATRFLPHVDAPSSPPVQKSSFLQFAGPEELAEERRQKKLLQRRLLDEQTMGSNRGGQSMAANVNLSVQDERVQASNEGTWMNTNAMNRLRMLETSQIFGEIPGGETEQQRREREKRILLAQMEEKRREREAEKAKQAELDRLDDLRVEREREALEKRYSRERKKELERSILPQASPANRSYAFVQTPEESQPRRQTTQQPVQQPELGDKPAAEHIESRRAYSESQHVERSKSSALNTAALEMTEMKQLLTQVLEQQKALQRQVELQRSANELQLTHSGEEAARLTEEVVTLKRNIEKLSEQQQVVVQNISHGDEQYVRLKKVEAKPSHPAMNKVSRNNKPPKEKFVGPRVHQGHADRQDVPRTRRRGKGWKVDEPAVPKSAIFSIRQSQLVKNVRNEAAASNGDSLSNVTESDSELESKTRLIFPEDEMHFV